LDTAGRRDAAVAAGRRRAAGFTWERCAEGLEDLYRAAADARAGR